MLCQEDTYLTELVRYIHLNPCRAGPVRSLEALSKYPYCGHSVLLGNQKRDWQDSDRVLCYFGKQRNRAIRHYDAFVAVERISGRWWTDPKPGRMVGDKDSRPEGIAHEER